MTMHTEIQEQKTSAVVPVHSGDKPMPKLALAFVGSVFPDTPEFRNAAFSPAGRMFQENLLAALADAGMPASLVVSVHSMPSFPGFRRLWVGSQRVSIRGDIRVHMVSFFNLTPLKQIWIGFATVWNLLKWAWSERGARRVIYTYNLTVPPGLFTLLAGRLVGASVVVSLNDINVPGQTVPDSRLNQFDFWLQRHLIPRFDGFVAVADAIMADFAPSKTYLRVEGGISDSLLSQVQLRRGQPHVSSDSFSIVFAGSLDEVNGVDLLLDAFSLIKGDYQLIIAGAGPLQQKVEVAAQQDPRIKYVGFLSLPELVGLYTSADLLVSLRPTKDLHTKYFYPSKIMEYLCSGTPVLATCTGHTEKEFGEFCYLLRNETAEGVAEMICNIAKSPSGLRNEMGRRAHGYMERNKTWQRQGEKLVQYFREIVFRSNAKAEASYGKASMTTTPGKR